LRRRIIVPDRYKFEKNEPAPVVNSWRLAVVLILALFDLGWVSVRRPPAADLPVGRCVRHVRRRPGGDPDQQTVPGRFWDVFKPCQATPKLQQTKAFALIFRKPHSRSCGWLCLPRAYLLFLFKALRQ
jgi:hypothetical protein